LVNKELAEEERVDWTRTEICCSSIDCRAGASMDDADRAAQLCLPNAQIGTLRRTA